MSIDWKDIAKAVGASAPLLGTALLGPAGTAVGSIIASVLGVGASPDEVSAALATNPDAAVKLKQIEKERQVELQGLAVQHAQHAIAAETASIQAVNQTMQAEAKAEHWPTYSWRPFCGFVFGVTFFGVYFVLPLAKVPVPTVPFEAWVALGSILGVASWFRGKAQADPVNPIPAGRG
jgi:hypothetical protein